MVFPSTASNGRRLRVALLIALGLHLLLAWRYLPEIAARLQIAGTKFAAATQADPQPEEVVEISPPPPPPPSRRMELASRLGNAASPEALPPPLPEGFFERANPLAAGSLHLADELDFVRTPAATVVANIVPAAVRLPGITALSDRARTPAPRSAARKPDPGQKAPTQPARAAPLPEPRPEPLPTTQEYTLPPFLLPPKDDSASMDAAIARAASEAERNARQARQSAAPRPAPDYRALLRQGPLIPDAPHSPSNNPASENQSIGITTYALDAPPAFDNRRAAPDEGRAVAAARQQFFSLLTARLKATNQRLLAESVRAGERTSVRLKFLLDRDGTVLDIELAEPAARELAVRAAAVIRAAQLPRVPDAMTQVPLELTFPIEVYR